MTRAVSPTLGPFSLPDYEGGCTVNLLASVIGARGGTSPHAEIRCLGSDELAPASWIVCVVIDGLGALQLDAYLADHPPADFTLVTLGPRELEVPGGVS